MRKVAGLIVGLFICYPLAGEAAVLFFSAERLQSNIAKVTVWLDTEGEEANAVEGEILAPPDGSVISLSTTESAFPLWVREPAIQDSKIIFAGIVPGGVSGDKINIFSFLINLSQGKKEKKFSWGKARVLLNDGEGTETETKKSEWKLSVADNFSALPVFPPDKLPPKFLSVEIARSKYLFDNNLALVFAAEDKGSGIDFYAIQENQSNQVDEGNWQRATSPYLLADQSRQSYVFVKAVDKAGNFSIFTLPPRKVSWYEKYYNLFILIIALIAIFLAIKKYAAKNK